MTLDTYLKTHRISRSTFAAFLGVSRQAVDYWAKGERFPKPDIILRIERITGGKVSVFDWYQEIRCGGSE